MSTRTTLRPTPVITAGDMSGNITSLVTILQSITGCSYAGNWLGSTAVGTLSVQVSNDYQANGGTVLNAGTWTTITVQYSGNTVQTIPVSGSTGTFFIDLTKIQAYAIRLVYTATSGAGTLNATINGKVS